MTIHMWGGGVFPPECKIGRNLTVVGGGVLFDYDTLEIGSRVIPKPRPRRRPVRPAACDVSQPVQVVGGDGSGNSWEPQSPAPASAPQLAAL